MTFSDLEIFIIRAAHVCMVMAHVLYIIRAVYI